MSKGLFQLIYSLKMLSKHMKKNIHGCVNNIFFQIPSYFPTPLPQLAFPWWLFMHSIPNSPSCVFFSNLLSSLISVPLILLNHIFHHWPRSPVPSVFRFTRIVWSSVPEGTTVLSLLVFPWFFPVSPSNCTGYRPQGLLQTLLISPSFNCWGSAG